MFYHVIMQAYVLQHSRQNQKCHGNIKFPTAKQKCSRQNQIPYGETKMLTAKPKSSRQNQKDKEKMQGLTGRTSVPACETLCKPFIILL